MSSADTITLSIASFFVILVLLVFLRLLTRRTEPSWRRIRLGVFVEREPADEDDPLPPTTYQRPVRRRDDLHDQ